MGEDTKNPPVGGNHVLTTKSRKCPKLPDGTTWEELIEVVTKIAKNFKRSLPPSTTSLDDLIQVGSLGLVQAYASYECGRGIAFMAFAVFRIKGAMRDHLRDLDLMTRLDRQKVKAGEWNGSIPAIVPLIEAYEEPDHHRANPEVSVAEAEELRLLQEAVDSLPERLKILYRLHFLEGGERR